MKKEDAAKILEITGNLTKEIIKKAYRKAEQKILKAIRVFLSQNKKPTFTAVAKKINMSREHLSRNYKYIFRDVSYTKKALKIE